MISIVTFAVVVPKTLLNPMQHAHTYTQQNKQLRLQLHLPIPNVDIPVPTSTEWPLVHIVNTRFMQEQGPLTTLGMARFKLFMTFCFPTMINQSVQNFFWIIKMDPKFTTTFIFQLFVNAVQDYPNIYLVASNQNYLISPDQEGSWRDGAEGLDLLGSRIYTGNITQLHQAIALRNERPILETRLDADDGLHAFYIQYIQSVAMKQFKRSENAPRWLYWCTRRHIEWHSSMSTTNNNTNTKKGATSKELQLPSKELPPSKEGLVNPVQHSKLCITPGITVGYNVGVESKDVPVHSHDLLYANLVNSTACYGAKGGASKSSSSSSIGGSCLNLVQELAFCAVRSRTWTSAGMQNVPLEQKYLLKSEMVGKLWQLLEERFSINRTMAEETQAYLIQHERQIAYENLLGQCTTGHSCKDQAKQDLQQYIIQHEDSSNTTTDNNNNGESKLEKLYPNTEKNQGLRERQS
jgi:hypothetical protein